MEIQKIFSDYYDEERYYSVLMTEGELELLQRAYARIDYAGLSKNAAAKLKQDRSSWAKLLNKERNAINKSSGFLGKDNTNFLRNEVLDRSRGVRNAILSNARSMA